MLGADRYGVDVVDTNLSHRSIRLKPPRTVGVPLETTGLTYPVKPYWHRCITKPRTFGCYFGLPVRIVRANTGPRQEISGIRRRIW